MPEVMGAESETPIAESGDRERVIKTILLVEDEGMVRELLREVLERDGYEVLACSLPEEGIEVSRRCGGQIDLLLTDVVMPGMNGRQMANKILKELPELRVVFMSGYTEHALTHDGQVEEQFEYLQKPFTLQTLSRKLTRVLGEKVQ